MTTPHLYHMEIKVKAIRVEYNFCSVFNICSEQKGFFALRKFRELLGKVTETHHTKNSQVTERE